MRCRLFPALCVRWLKAGNSPSAQTARLFTLHLLQSLYRKQSEACPLPSLRLVRPPGLLSFFKLVYCHCSFVALGGKMPPSVFLRGGVLKAGGLGGWGIAGSALPSVSGALRALAKSRELAFGSDSPAFYAALASGALSETVGGLPLQSLRLVRPPGLLSFFKLVYCHCSFVALGGKMPPSAFFIGGVLKAGGLGGWGVAGSALPSVSGALRALAKSRELAFGSDSPAFYAALASVALSETVGGLPPQSLRLVRPPGLLSFFKLVYCHCSFVALGRGLPPPVFYEEEFCEWVQSVILRGHRSPPRFMKKDPFRTSIVCTPAPDAERLGVHSGVLFMGSCFAGNVGQRMEEACFKVLVNPHGVLFNPFSVAAALEAFLENRQVGLGDLVERDGLWHSFQHHGSFSGCDAAKVVQDVNAATLKGHSFLKEARCLVVTFGTAWVYALGEAQQVVANCHKFPARDFQRYRLSVRAVVERWQSLLVALRQVNPDLQVIFTVSPVRHWKDGAHGNQLSKAVLLLAVEELVEQDGRNAYFPAYELMMDELRDYRFYADDMLHPSAQAVDYIWDRFSGAWLNEEALAFYREVQHILGALRHRPLHPGALSFESFRKKTAQKIADLVKRYPNLEFRSLEGLVQQ